MAKSLLTDQGVGKMVTGSFISDLAQLWGQRIFNPLEHTATSEEDKKFEHYIDALQQSDIPEEIGKMARRLEEAKNGIVGNVSTISYRHGFQDGVRMIIQSIMG